jgi:predicted transcriptional regulator of viral defense system
MYFYPILVTMETRKPIQKVIALFRQQGGTLRTSEALRLGIHPRTLYAMRDSGLLDQLSRGLFRLAELPPLSNPDLTTVALKVPQAVICLVSALAFHELTTQIPHAVDIALPSGAERPRLDYPPLRIFWFSGPAWSEGVETHMIDDTPVRIYSLEKSVADSFKFRRKIGLDVALEALKLYRQHHDFDVSKLLHYARICRVEKVMRPYLEALL